MKKILITSVCLIGFIFCGEKTSDFSVKGMMCSGGCVKKINRAMDSIEGIKSREVNFEKEMMTVIYDDELVNDKIIITALEKNNYSCSLKEAPKEKTKKESPVKLFFKNLFN